MAGVVSSQAQSYNITDLGALPGDIISFPAGLNSLGQAAGTSANATSGIATLYSDGNAISLGTLGGFGFVLCPGNQWLRPSCRL